MEVMETSRLRNLAPCLWPLRISPPKLKLFIFPFHISMASQGRRGGVSLLDRPNKEVAADAAFVTKKILWSTGKAGWIVGTTFLILVVLLIVEMDREQQLNDLELQQASLLGTPAPK